LNRAMPEYLVVMLFGTITGLVTSLVGFYAKLDIGQTMILILVSEILLIEISSYISLQRSRRKSAIEVLRGEAKIFKRCIKMQKDAEALVYALWCIPRYTLTVEKYFDEATEYVRKKLKLKICRLINIREAGAERVKEHLASSLDILRSGKYVVYSTSHKAFEYLVIDRKNALFLAPHAIRDDLYMAICGREESFVYCLIELFDDLCRRGTELKIPDMKDESQLKAYINNWIDTQAKES